VQMFLVVALTVLIAVLALGLPDIGGISGMIEKAPKRHYDWSELARPGFIALWLIGLVLTKCFEENSIDKSAKYLMTRSDRHARLTLIIPLLGMILGPLLWLVPPTVAAIRHPDMAVLFPSLKFPEEGAFLATAMDVLPQGMIGLLLCGIFAATLTTMDAGLNQGAGIFVRNFYLPVLHPGCPEKKLLVVSKIATGVSGAIMMGSAMAWNSFRSLGLFDLVNQVAVSLGLPMAIPLCLGLFWRKTPPWAAWSTVLVGLATSFVVKAWLKPEMFAWIPGLQGPYTVEEVTQFNLFATILFVGGACTGWFFATTVFYEKSDPEYKQRVEDFFHQVNTPVTAKPDEELREDQAIGGSIGKLCLIYGSFVSALAAIPNPPAGRACFLACGGAMALAGLLLWRGHRTRKPPLLSGESDDPSR
jgi:SSS family solute:Na+ symporter